VIEMRLRPYALFIEVLEMIVFQRDVVPVAGA
jgi:hypothetical protein